MKVEKIRQDAWSHEDDLLLAETVLRHIREGSTQLKAFEEVADKLHRTAAACGFRWNAEIRSKYEQAIEIAKKQRKERKRLLANQFIAETPIYSEQNTHDDNGEKALNLDKVIVYLQYINQKSTSKNYAKIENERLRQENKMLQQKKEALEQKLQKLKERQTTIKEDYQSLIQIMDRARKMVMLEDVPTSPANDSLGQLAE